MRAEVRGLAGIATRLSIFVGEGDTHDKPLHHEIVTRARDAGLAGATVIRGCGMVTLEHVEVVRYAGRRHP
jgi:uncharacterized protein DUF190